METLRCPTCLTLLLEGGERRCPACKARLRKRRAQPIILRESSRLDSHPPSPIDRELLARADAPYSSEVRDQPDPAPMLAPYLSETRDQPRPAPLPEPPAMDLIFPEPESGPIPELPAEIPPGPAPEPVLGANLILEAAPRLEGGAAREPAPAPLFIDLTIPEREREREPEPVSIHEQFPEPAWATASTATSDISRLQGGDFNDVLAELHRKARAERDDDPKGRSSRGGGRALRLSAPRTSSRRRWMRRTEDPS